MSQITAEEASETADMWESWANIAADRKPVDPPPILQLEVPPHNNHILQSKGNIRVEVDAKVGAH